MLKREGKKVVTKEKTERMEKKNNLGEREKLLRKETPKKIQKKGRKKLNCKLPLWWTPCCLFLKKKKRKKL